MATLREDLEQSAFWHGQTCVQCGACAEEDETGPCEACGGQLVDSRQLLAFVVRAEEDDCGDESIHHHSRGGDLG